jgi:3',5'-cyclic AMP phosphodiesterase CpdA
MPGIDYQPINRKQFFSTSIGAMGAIVLGGATRAWGQLPESFRVALLSDTHIPADPTEAFRSFRPYENLQTIVPQVVASAPQAVIVNGDAARLTGERADYEALKRLLKPLAGQVPVIIGLGNHDNRKNFFEVFGKSPGMEQTVAGKHVVVLEGAPVRIVVLDSLMRVNETAGLLGKAQRAWLAKFLQQAGQKPTVLFVHHTLGDGDGDLLDADRLLRMIKPHPQVKAIFYGHSHRYSVTRREGLHLVNLPAVGYNSSDQQPVGWVDAEFTPSGVLLTLHAIGGNRADDGKTTTIAW